VPALANLSFSQKFSRVYLLMSAIQYFAASASVIDRFYGEDEAAQIAGEFPQALREQVQHLLQSGT